MTNQQSSRSEQLLELGRLGMESLIEEPVKESVREALAEERILAADQAERTGQQDDEEQTGDGNRLLRPVLLLPVLGLAAGVVILRRRRLMEVAEESGMIEQVDAAIPTHATNQRTTADSEPTDTGDSTDYGGSGNVPDGKRPSDFGNFDDDTGTDESSDYDADNSDENELSTPE